MKKYNHWKILLCNIKLNQKKILNNSKIEFDDITICSLCGKKSECECNTDFKLQSAVINKLSIFTNNNPIKTLNSNNITLHEDVEEWIPNDEDEEKN